jgi:hypothetical protein
VSPAKAAKRSGPARQRPRLGGADYEIVKVAAHLESARLFDPAGLHRVEAGRSDQPLDFLASTVMLLIQFRVIPLSRRAKFGPGF